MSPIEKVYKNSIASFLLLLIKHKHSTWPEKFLRQYASAIYRTSFEIAHQEFQLRLSVKSTTKCRGKQYTVCGLTRTRKRRAFYALPTIPLPLLLNRRMWAYVLCFRTNTLKMSVRRGYNKHISHHMYHMHTQTHTRTHAQTHIAYGLLSMLYISCMSCAQKSTVVLNGFWIGTEKKENSWFGER